MIRRYKAFLSRRGCLWLLVVALVLSTLGSGQTQAMSLNDYYSNNDINFYDPNGCDYTSVASSPVLTSVATSASPSILAFAKQPINSDWGISDSAAEQWFLGTKTRAIKKYGLSASNIGQVTAAIKANGISVPFFYAYTVEEGSTLGGFINHFPRDTSGGAVGNAARDAQYLANQSQKVGNKSNGPAWVDAGNPVDFVPSDVKIAGNADFQSMPAGTIGRVYIPATAATTWEVYYPNGLKKAYNGVQDYGPPLQNVMKRITDMGGNPGAGGSTAANATSCAGSTGSGLASEFSGDGFAVYKQCDPSWAEASFGDSNVCRSGCGQAAMAMIITALTGQTVTPDQTAAYLPNQRQQGGSSWDTPKGDGPHWGLRVESIEWTVESVNEVLDAGGMVWVCGQNSDPPDTPFTSGGHCVAVRGRTADGKWVFFDSAGKVGDKTRGPDAAYDPATVITYGNSGSAWALYKE